MPSKVPASVVKEAWKDVDTSVVESSVVSTRRQSSIFSLSRWKRESTTSVCSVVEEPIRATISVDPSLCPVCLRDLKSLQVLNSVCGHSFHSQCLKNVRIPVSGFSFLGS